MPVQDQSSRIDVGLQATIIVPIGSANVPATPIVRLEVSLSRRRVFVYRDGVLVTDYPIAIGKKGWETPIGKWKIYSKIENPGWTSFLSGRKVAPGKNNPMGSRWIGYYKDSRGEIGFHGTTNTKSVGLPVSHGCNRMLEKDVRQLFPQVKIGDEVRVTY